MLKDTPLTLRARYSMRAKLTKTAVERAKPKKRPYRIYDTQITGFSLRVQPTGKKSWVLQVRSKFYSEIMITFCVH